MDGDDGKVRIDNGGELGDGSIAGRSEMDVRIEY